jgi:hypothetical protein
VTDQQDLVHADNSRISRLIARRPYNLVRPDIFIDCTERPVPLEVSQRVGRGAVVVGRQGENNTDLGSTEA